MPHGKAAGKDWLYVVYDVERFLATQKIRSNDPPLSPPPRWFTLQGLLDRRANSSATSDLNHTPFPRHKRAG